MSSGWISYLERLGTTNLRIRNLERELERPHPLIAMTAIATRLASVYAESLSTVSDPKELADLGGQAAEPIDRCHPRSDSPRVRLTLSRAITTEPSRKHSMGSVMPPTQPPAQMLWPAWQMPAS